MSVIEELLENNRAFAESVPSNQLDLRPSRELAIVTCMDSRIDVFQALGLKDGEAHILRNAGGVITGQVFKQDIKKGPAGQFGQGFRPVTDTTLQTPAPATTKHRHINICKHALAHASPHRHTRPC